MNLFRRTTDKKQPPARRMIHDQPMTADRSRTFSYHANRSTTEGNTGREPSAVEARAAAQGGKTSRLQRLLWMILTIGVIVLLGDQTMLSGSPRVVPLSDTSSQIFLRPISTYQQAATVLFRKSFVNRNKLTINTAGIDDGMKRQFPELSAVSVTLPLLGRQPTVYVQPLEPSIVLTTKSSGAFVLDANGKALIVASGRDMQGSLTVPAVVDQSGLHISVGQAALPSTTTHFIVTVVAQLKAQHIGIASMTLPPAASELNVYIAGQPFYVKFNTEDSSALQQVGTFVATYKHLKAQGIMPGQYIDVRINGRAYYK